MLNVLILVRRLCDELLLLIPPVTIASCSTLSLSVHARCDLPVAVCEGVSHVATSGIPHDWVAPPSSCP